MSELRTHPLASGHPPAWAWGWGKDRFGVFTEIKLGEAVQRLRWIFPGTFKMGSPEAETGRAIWEGPRHRVHLSKGFWLADTPCTQALWGAVMGENPSRFPSPDRPVERVNWEDCQRFVQGCEGLQPGLSLRLPTEAQWEYACRAGEGTAIWKGDLEMGEERDAPFLDSIAAYGGNSGVDFDLAEGHDSSGWKEKQSPHSKAGTRRVKTKEANPWGLYDMLGNVWEWCSDRAKVVRGYPGGDRVDPELQDGTSGVIRGGSWGAHARGVRVLGRFWSGPGSRNGLLGFRLSRGPE